MDQMTVPVGFEIAARLEKTGTYPSRIENRLALWADPLAFLVYTWISSGPRTIERRVCGARRRNIGRIPVAEAAS